MTVAGSLQSELGCPDGLAAGLRGDATWPSTRPTGRWHATFTLPAGSYEWKVAIDDSWDRQLRRRRRERRQQPGADVPDGGATYVFTWDQVTHEPSVAPVP